jgi:cytochrome c553
MRSLAVAVLASLAALPVAAATLEERLAPCLGCHGEQGQSAIAAVPSLGAQPAFYSNARRGYDASMADVMYPVTDADILDLAHFLARLR